MQSPISSAPRQPPHRSNATPGKAVCGRAKTVSAQTTKQQMLRMLVCTDAPEQALRYHGAKRIAGVDEVGRGALFGPVVAAAVILPEDMHLLAEAGLKDSKQMQREDRERLDSMIREMAVAVAVAEVNAETIDRINIYQASRLAMLLAVQHLPIEPDHLLIDAMRIDHSCAQTKLIYGDSLSLSIAAASVVAKVYRDAMMRTMDEQFPAYGLAAHKGYGTPFHRRALAQFGPTPLHRKTFAPVAAVDDRGSVMALEFTESDALNEPTEPVTLNTEENPCRFD
jgi:ribonuclease HII